MADPSRNPHGWLRETRLEFDALVRHGCIADAERYLRRLEPEAARCMDALPAASVGLAADLQAHCLELLELLELSTPLRTEAEGREVAYRDDGALAEPPPEPAADPDPGEVAYILKGRRLPLSEWLWRWRECMTCDPPETLAALFFHPDHKEARGQIRRDTMLTGPDGRRRLDPEIEAELVACEELGDGRCEGAIKRGGRPVKPAGGEVPSRSRARR